MIDPNDAAKYVHNFYFNKLNWCGCGDAESVMVLMRNVLAAIKWNSDEGDKTTWGASGSHEDFKRRYEAYKDKIRPLLGEIGSPVCYTYFYLLDSLRLTEHGGSVVNGGWLTDDGRELLENLHAVGNLEWSDLAYTSEVTE